MFVIEMRCDVHQRVFFPDVPTLIFIFGTVLTPHLKITVTRVPAFTS